MHPKTTVKQAGFTLIELLGVRIERETDRTGDKDVHPGC